ncbi:MAG: A24 family peptidase [bacterium]
MPLSAIFAFIFGAALGSFLNVVILRNKSVKQASQASSSAGKTGAGKTLGVNGKTPRVALPAEASGEGWEEAGILRGRSHCPFCHKKLAWPELIPILSFIFLRGRCRTCHNQISLQYPLLELAIGVFTLILFTPLPATSAAFAIAVLSLISIALLIILFVIDLRTMLLPDIFIIILAVVVVLSLFINYSLQPTAYSLITALLGMTIGSGVLAFLWLITRGRGIGLGDVKLMLPLGALFGPIGTITLLFPAFISGGAVGAFLLLTGRANMKTPVPFGPFLAGVAILFILIPELPQAILNIII